MSAHLGEVQDKMAGVDVPGAGAAGGKKATKAKAPKGGAAMEPDAAASAAAASSSKAIDSGAAGDDSLKKSSKESKEELTRVEGYIAKVRKAYDSAKFGGEWTADESVSAVEALEGLNFSEVTEGILQFKGDLDDKWRAGIAFAELFIYIAKDLPTKPGKLAKTKGKNTTLNTTFKDWLDDMLNNYGTVLNKVWTELVLKSDGKLASKQMVQKARGLPAAGLKDLGDIADVFEQYDEMYGKKKESKGEKESKE